MSGFIAQHPQVRWGIVFGVPQAALVLAGACAGAVDMGEDLGLGSHVTFGYLYLWVLGAVVTAMIFLAGKRAARQMHHVLPGVVAGVVAAEICAVTITLIAWLAGIVHDAPLNYYINRLVFPELAAAIVGAALGMIGGLAGS